MRQDRRSLPAPARLARAEPVRAPRGLDPELLRHLRLAALEPAALRPAAVRSLQGRIGNRAVGALLQRHEREADAVAQRVAGGGQPPSPAAEAAAHPLDVTPQVESGIAAARGGGRPLAAPLRADLERSLGADLADVRLHTDLRADRLSRELQARAFTSGRDIFFRAGEPDPTAAPGRRVLAHELAHVLQQRGGRPASGAQPGLGSVPAGAVQRLISEADFKKLAGEPSGKSKLDRGTYTKILQQLGKYERAATEADKRDIRAKLVRLCRKWMRSHTDVLTGDGPMDKGDLRKASFIPALLEEVKAESKAPFDASVQTPSQTTAILANELQDAQDAAAQEQTMAAPSRHVLTLYVSVENPVMLEFAQKRLELTIKNRTRLRGKRQTGAQIKAAAATHAVDTFATDTGQQLDAATKQSWVDWVVDNSNAVGHAWVRLTTLDDQNQILSDHNFGFYPLKGYNRPELSVPGQVVFRDVAHAQDDDLSSRQYEISAQQYQAALTNVLDTMAARPDYKLVKYNCTLFAKQVVEAAGQAFPNKAYMKVPSGPLSAITGLGWRSAYNPNALADRIKSANTVAATAQDSESESETPPMTMGELLAANINQGSLELETEFDALKQGTADLVTLPPGSRLQVTQVRGDDPDQIVEFTVPHAGSHETDDLAGLCAALNLI